MVARNSVAHNATTDGTTDFGAIMRYSGGYPVYREHCDAVAANGYRELALG